MEATFSDGRQAWGAIGFQNSVSDSPADKRQAKKKFSDDMKRALKEKPDLEVFVFFCNVALTVGERDTLAKEARKSGIKEVDVFDRERIRIALDSPEGLSTRFQCLDLELSSAEQAAFFSRWGSDIQSLVSKSFNTVESRLSRIEFFLERERPLTRLDFLLEFDAEVTRAELGHFRVDFTMMSDPPDKDIRLMHIGICNDRAEPPRSDCYSTIIWTTPIAGQDVASKKGRKNQVLSKGHGLLESPVSVIRGSITEHFQTIPIFGYKLGDLEGNPFLFFVTPNIASRIARITVVANEYVIFSSERGELMFSEHDYKFEWPVQFTAAELKQPWIRVMYRYDASRFNFSRYSPTRFFRPKMISLPPPRKA